MNDDRCWSEAEVPVYRETIPKKTADLDLLLHKVEVKTGRREEGRVEILNPAMLGDREVLMKEAFFLL
jgi:hypothetical protein